MINPNQIKKLGLLVAVFDAKITQNYSMLDKWTMDDWLLLGTVPNECKSFPNAIKALEILNSPLSKALKEHTDEDKSTRKKTP